MGSALPPHDDATTAASISVAPAATAPRAAPRRGECRARRITSSADCKRRRSFASTAKRTLRHNFQRQRLTSTHIPFTRSAVVRRKVVLPKPESGGAMRIAKVLVILLAVIASLAVGAGAALRLNRSKASGPTTVKPSLVAVVNAGGIYVFAARAGGHVILFDTGADPEGRPVDVALEALAAGRGDVSDVFLTHGHMDHTAGAAQLPRAKIHLGAGDVDLAAGKASPEAIMVKVMNLVLPAPPVTTT